MPSEKTVSPLAKIGQRLNKSVAKHATDATKYGIVRLPPGINNGIARLKECGFGVYKEGANKGQPFFRAMGVVVSPESIETADGPTPVAGLQTSIIVPLCDTKNADGQETSFDEHVETVMNEMRKLGGPDFTASAETAEDLASLANDLVEAAPYFRFSTSAGKKTPKYPTPRTWENWHGSKGLEDYSPPDAEPEDDQSGDVEEPEEKPSKPAGKGTKPTPSGNGKPRKDLKTAAKKVEEEEPEESAEEPDFNDLESLAERADEGDEDAAATLAEHAANAGIDEDTVTSAKSWSSIVELIKGRGSEEDEEGDESAEDEEVEEEEEESSGPEIGSVWMYRPIDKKTKKPGKPVKVEVMEVSEDGDKVTIRSKTKPPVVYKGVSVEKLSEIE